MRGQSSSAIDHDWVLLEPCSQGVGNKKGGTMHMLHVRETDTDEEIPGPFPPEPDPDPEPMPEPPVA